MSPSPGGPAPIAPAETGATFEGFVFGVGRDTWLSPRGTSQDELGRPSDNPAGVGTEVVLLSPAPDADALAVAGDELVGTAECVLKPIGRPRGACRGAVGATILDAGEIALVLDVPAVAGRPAAPACADPRPSPCP